MKTLYVGNLPQAVTEDQVRQLFELHGTVHSVSLIRDEENGHFRGFCFVRMSAEGAALAERSLDGVSHFGRPLRVCEMRERRKSARVDIRRRAIW
jgi:RNA recognition motif-containing protein